ncbi:hypothetical protein [Bradyrhizobium sp. USDA 3364]
MDHPIRLADILAALRRLDGEDDDPPQPGDVPMRLRRPWTAAPQRTHHDVHAGRSAMVVLGQFDGAMGGALRSPHGRYQSRLNAERRPAGALRPKGRRCGGLA